MAGDAGRREATGGLGAAEDGHTSGTSSPPPHPDTTAAAYDAPSADASPPQPAPVPALVAVFRDPVLPRLPARLNRYRTGQVRDWRITARFAAGERDAIEAAAERYSLTPAGFVGNAAVAYATTGLDPADVLFPQQALLDRLERLAEQLRRHGHNLNQLTKAAHTGEIPEQAAEILAGIEALRRRVYAAMDTVVAAQPGRGGAAGGA